MVLDQVLVLLVVAHKQLQVAMVVEEAVMAMHLAEDLQHRRRRLLGAVHLRPTMAVIRRLKCHHIHMAHRAVVIQ